ncbi:MAG: peptidase [Clostridia bacterium]|nr:peptidase [Clostridia bacterium]
MQQQKQLTFTIASYDGLKLHGLYLPCPEPSEKTVILIHGYNSWNGSMGGFAQHYLQNLGCNVLLPDLRGHGQSEGSYIGFGWHDRRDILQWINLILKENGCDTEIILHGVSMGGAAVLMTSGEVLPLNVKCIISDCAYS